ncbi:oligosaccharyl transferase, archaeosortase system-associated [Archaeoglobus sulfaticallidus PM70-1]|uniref:dolichyl-phosphooligosaccharide-protein glycotransferase n=1 Tax=Archaeoglobus sulfaticallidus PM70-1 TaxID=387631 RepID=N0BEA1_9EURY|nr:oligosaccharyl transferase, archaeosortase A system-associated [Archaeoglobus sulfaticallidus]AGK61949.1 oligosaccharyl transferase, archaeosortase system-associated [Archaeoglobus sulfaticallidus PM70-1]
MSKLKDYWQWFVVIAAIIIGLYIRIINPWNSVFVSWMDGARLSGNDPWYYFRLIDSALHNSGRIWFDAFTNYPHGTYTHFGPFLVYLSVLAVKITGAATLAEVRTTIAFIPAIAGSLLAVPAYILGSSIFNKRVGAASALLVVLIPGQLMARSVLSFNDHHIWEVFWQLSTLACFAFALKRFEDVRKHFIYPVIAGLCLGLYLLAWAPGFIIALIILGYVFLAHLTSTYLDVDLKKITYISAIVFLVGALIYLPFAFKYPSFSTTRYSPFQLIVLLAAAIIVLLFRGIEILKNRGHFNKVGLKDSYAFPLSIVVIVVLFIGGVAIISPDFLKLLTRIVGVVQPKGGALTVAEIQPFFSMYGEPSLTPAWRHFSITFFFAMPGMLYVAYLLIKQRDSKYLLILVWGLAMFAALAGQNRFAYYFGAVSALFAAVFLDAIIKIYSGFLDKKYSTRIVIHASLWVIALAILVYNYMTTMNIYVLALLALAPAVIDILINFPNSFELHVDKIRGLLSGKKVTAISVISIILIVAPALALFYPTLSDANLYSKYSAGGINKQWYDALVWMKDNTPEKELYDKFYYEMYKPPEGYKLSDRYPYPDGVYSIISWWDYGHWITAIAHRIPVANPFQQGIGNKYNNVPGAAPFFTAFNESYANKIADELDVKYVVSDVEMATGKFYAMAVWAEGSLEKANRIYYVAPGYVYVTPNGQIGISLSTLNIPAGSNVIATMNVPSENYFKTMEARLHILDGSGLQNYRMVYESEFEAKNQLTYEALYRIIYNSNHADHPVAVTSTGYVKVFEYVKGVKVTGKASGSEVIVKANITTNQNRTFEYIQKAKVENGHYEIVLPYAQNTKYPVKASEYTIQSGNVTKTLTLSDEDVENGKIITLDLI